MKKNPRANLENYRKIFFQLGLVLTLALVYIGINHKSYSSVKELGDAVVNVEAMEDEPIFEIEKIEPVKPKAQPKVVDIIEKVKDDAEVIETVVDDTEVEEGDIIDLDEIIVDETGEDDVVEDVSFMIIENAPLYPGCRGKNQDQLKACFSTKIQKHIGRKFNADLASDLGLAPGKKKIYVMFTIDQKGDIINIRANAPHKRLQMEAVRVIELLPQMTPGSQRGVPVKVKYSLPIVFNVQ
ncbi:MAG: energy transducer TonB [Flavobacteriaceae bacterium]